METKFTPAPWQLKEWEEDDYTIDTGSKYFVGNSRYDICYLARNTTDGEDVSINDAHLIASAPDLYEALHCLTEEVKKMKADIKNHPKMIGHLFEADAALAKARGEQS